MNNLIGITGGKSMGKDTVGKIILYLEAQKKYKGALKPFKDVTFNEAAFQNLNYKIKKFATPIKKFVADILGVPVELLEDRAYKETPLGEEWNRWFIIRGEGKFGIKSNMLFVSKKEAVEFIKNNLSDGSMAKGWYAKKEPMTPRLLLQTVGTEVGRTIHPMMWINALFADYKPIGDNLLEGEVRKVREEDLIYPKWIITDVRFNNEAEAIKDRGGIIIKVERDTGVTDTHTSEQGVSDEYVDIVIDNNGSMNELTEKVKAIFNAS